MDKVIVWQYFLLILFAINLLQLMSGCGITTRCNHEGKLLPEESTRGAVAGAERRQHALGGSVVHTHANPYTMAHQCLTTDIG